jgi:predicted dehydrogenase
MRFTRRKFLESSLAAAASITVAGTKSSGKVLGANDTVRIGVAGLNGRGGSHVGAYLGMKDVQITHLIDPHQATYKNHLKSIAAKGLPAPTCVQDVRKALEDKNLDAISIATPNHWHALMTIWACQAGKDVYVEKPCSHNIHEGRVAVQAARKHKRIVQHGTQNRASGGHANTAALAASGKYGKLLVSRGLCYKDGGTGGSTRGNIGFKDIKNPPAELDFDIWTGPAQATKYHENLVHYRWHWFWDFGNGDMGNQGVHEMDKARWFIPGAMWPKSVMTFGGRFTGKDQGETPNTEVTVMDYGETLLIFEVRGQKSESYYGQGVGNVLHFEAGVVAGGKFFPKGKKDGEPVAKVTAEKQPEGDHFGNFIQCVKSRDGAKLNAEIEVGHVSSGLCHLANISYRLGKDEAFSGKTEAVKGNEFATEALARTTEYLTGNGVKLEDQMLRVGRKLVFNGDTETFTNDSEANALLTRKYRAPYVVPENV